MKEVLLSADNSAKLCRVPDRVAERSYRHYSPAAVRTLDFLSPAPV